MRSSKWERYAALLGALLALLGCRQIDTGGSTRSASATLEQAMALAAKSPELAERLSPTAQGFAFEGAGARSLAAKHAGDLAAHLPAHANGEMATVVGPWQLGWQLEGATGSALEIDEGRAVYRDAYPSTDVVITAEPSRVETFFVLRDASAPSKFAWDVSLPAGVAEVKREANWRDRLFG